MNNKAIELGLENTHFVTPHGLDEEEHYTTAYELAKLTNYALKNNTFYKIVKTQKHTININGNVKELSNTNELLGSLNGVYGVKTGFTNGANRCLVTACKRNNLDIISVVLGCDTKKDRGQDSTNLINYIFENFQKVNIKEIIKKEFENWNKNYKKNFEVNKGIDSDMNLILREEQIPYNEITINKNMIDKIDTSISFESFFEAPLQKETTIGTMDVLLDKEKLFSVEIINKNTIYKKNIVYYIKYFMENYCKYF